MKTHWIHCKNIADALAEIIDNGHHAEFVVKKYTSSNKQGSKDRRFIATAIFEIVKNYRYYRYLGTESDDSFPDWRPAVTAYLHESGYIPPKGGDWPVLKETDITDRKNALNALHAIRLSMPDWLYDLGHDAYGKQWNGLCDELRATAPIFLRVNLLLTNSTELSRYFDKKNIAHNVLNYECIRLHQRLQLSADDAFNKGWYEIQDIGSQRISHFANPASGHFVIDACAGAGGKALHMATLMENKGQILALDINDTALKNITQRASRHGIDIISTTSYDNLSKEESLTDSADIVLCDVPCSGTGVFRREVDKKLRLTPDHLNSLITTQAEILTRASRWVKPGGSLIYATCSILPAENEAQANLFQDRHPEFRKQDTQLLLPEQDGHDGFFMASFVKETEI